MARPPQLPPVDRAGLTNDATYYAWRVHADNMHLEMRRLREEDLLEKKVSPTIGIENTSRHIEKIDGEGYALYQTILDNPYDLAPRLIYADWLREHGDEERADFIQWMIELRDFDVHDHGQIARRFNWVSCRMLLDTNLATWHGLPKPVSGYLYNDMPSLPYGDVDLHWRNGFVDSVSINGPFTSFLHSSLLNLVKVHPVRTINFNMFAGDKEALEALSNILINRIRILAGLEPLKEHPKQVFNFKIDDPWFNPAMRGRLPYYRYPTGISARLEDRPTLHNWIQSGMLHIPPDWVRDQLGLPFIQTDDKKEGE